MIAQWFRSPLTRLACLLPVLTWLILSLVLIPTYHEAVSDIEGEVRNAIDEEILGLNQVLLVLRRQFNLLGDVHLPDFPGFENELRQPVPPRRPVPL